MAHCKHRLEESRLKNAVTAVLASVPARGRLLYLKRQDSLKIHREMLKPIEQWKKVALACLSFLFPNAKHLHHTYPSNI